MANTWIAGGRGTMAGAANNNGGGFYISGAATYLTCQDSNGGPTSSADTWNVTGDACTVTDTGYGPCYITGTVANSFDNCVAGTYAYIEFEDATYPDDWYMVESVEPGANRIIIPLAYSTNKTCNCHVGGAFSLTGGVATAIALLTNANDEVHIATDVNSSTAHLVSSSITMPGIAGGALTPIKIKGVNKVDGSDLSLTDARPIVEAITWLNNGLIHVNNAATDYYTWNDIVFDAKNNDYCVWAVTFADWHLFNNCSFRNSAIYGVLSAGSYWTLIGCDDQNCDGGVILSGPSALVLFHTSDSSGGHGVTLGGVRGVGVNCVSYGATLNGLLIGASNVGGCLVNCTSYGCGQWGVRINDSAYFSVVCGCTSTGDLYDYYFDNIATTHVGYFGHNHANGDNHYELGANDTFADLLQGDNITGDPKFVNAAANDFTLKHDSPLLSAGLNDVPIGGSGVVVGINVNLLHGKLG